MTERERLIETIAGEEVTPKAVLHWPGKPAVRLVEVANPFGQALKDGCDLNALLAASVEEGQAKLESYRAKTTKEISRVAKGYGDMVLYLLYGANEAWCTPMQYGGFYLEQDREILAAAQHAGIPVLLWVVGESGTYLDFVSDLPAHAIGWDTKAAGYPVAQMKAVRTGLVFAPDHAADIYVEPNTGGRTITEHLVLEATHAAV